MVGKDEVTISLRTLRRFTNRGASLQKKLEQIFKKP